MAAPTACRPRAGTRSRSRGGLSPTTTVSTTRCTSFATAYTNTSRPEASSPRTARTTPTSSSP
eukprot:869671-Pyramimonas_sp.AAC.1